MGLQLHKKKDKDLYNVYSTVSKEYLYKWSTKNIIATHIYSKFQQSAREKAKDFMNTVDKEV